MRGIPDDDVFWMIMAAPLLIPLLLPALGKGASSWLVDHHVLVAGPAILVPMPGTHVGLDGTRLAVALALLIVVAAACLSHKLRKAGDES